MLATVDEKTCTVDGCGRTGPIVKGFCDKHYRRWKKYGDPLFVQKDHRPLEIRWRDTYSVNENGCWIWPTVNNFGYGQASDGAGTRISAHRFVYEQVRGQIPKSLELDHLCRVRSCVNPDHLEPVTHKVNVERGDAGIKNSAKTHCDHGHEFTPENTYRPPKFPNRRNCRACMRRSNREAMKRYRERQKAQ